jgi:hypothetical protein
MLTGTISAIVIVARGSIEQRVLRAALAQAKCADRVFRIMVPDS